MKSLTTVRNFITSFILLLVADRWASINPESIPDGFPPYDEPHGVTIRKMSCASSPVELTAVSGA